MMMHTTPYATNNQACGNCFCYGNQQSVTETKAGCTTPYAQNSNIQEKLLWLADEAWEELMREKIRDHIEASCGLLMDSLAELAAKTSAEKWQHKMAAKHLNHTFKHTLKDLLNKEGNGHSPS
jgi:hypothetical protein